MMETLQTITGNPATVGSVVRKYVSEHKRGCPEFILLAAGFSRKQINAAKDCKVVESVKGKTGGFYPFGEVPEKQEVTESLKEKAFVFLQSLYDSEVLTGTIAGECEDLLIAYETEKANRAKAKAASESAPVDPEYAAKAS